MRTSVEIDQATLDGIKLIAVRRRMKVKQVANMLLRFAFRHVDSIFPKPEKPK